MFSIMFISRDCAGHEILEIHVQLSIDEFSKKTVHRSVVILKEPRLATNVTTPLSGTICRPYAGTCYDQYAHQI